MTEMKEVGRIRTQLLDDFRNRRRYWELKEEAEDKKKDGNDSLSIEHKEEIHIFHKSMDLLISRRPNNNNFKTLNLWLTAPNGATPVN